MGKIMDFSTELSRADFADKREQLNFTLGHHDEEIESRCGDFQIQTMASKYLCEVSINSLCFQTYLDPMTKFHPSIEF